MKTFLSSTFIDLVQYRTAATETLEKLDQQVERMEIFNANASEPSEVALNELKQCDIFIGIYAYRYGTIPKGNVFSITELEYDYAKELEIPRFCFLIDEDFPWNPKMIERGKQTKLKNFKKKIKADLVIEFFTTPEDLAFKIATSIGNHLSSDSNIIKKKRKEPSKVDLNKIKEFERNYLNQVGNFNKLITIPHFDRAPRIHIDKIFVNPNFIRRTKKREDESREFSYEEFLQSINHTVVIGDPGAGKSTLAQKICYELFKNYEKKLINNKLLTPVLIVLRDYSSNKEEKGYSILEFAESEVTAKYQLPRPPPDKAFEILFKDGNIIMIFDGLDELLDTSKRHEITQDIESFCNLYPDVLILVTSRVVGYEQAPLDPDVFETFIISPFDEYQIGEYVEKWFNNKEVSCQGDMKKNKEAFLKESEIAVDLRSNPLMLALMCNLYRGAGFIPRNRPELYRKCSEMLFERWDPSRGIWIQLSISEPKALLSRLAYQIYSKESLLSGISETQIIHEATNFLFPRSFEFEEEAEKASKEFIEFCKGRAWVFTDVGTTPDGQSIYKFTHKTFLEYFTAVYIIRTHNTPEKLWNLLKPKIIARTWDVVAQLCFQKLHEQVEGASNLLIDSLLKEAEENLENRWSLLSFGARCLQFIHPSPKIIRNLTEASILNIIESSNTFEKQSIKIPKEYPFRNMNTDLLIALTTASQECRKIIANVIQDFIKESIREKDQKFVIKVLQFGLSLTIGLHRVDISAELSSFWKDIEKLIYNDNLKRIEEFVFEDFIIFLLWSRLKKPDNLIELIINKFSIEHLFYSPQHKLYRLYYSSQANLLVRILWFPLEDESNKYKEFINYYSKQILYLDAIIMNQELPCFSYDALEKLNPRLHFLMFKKDKKIEGLLIKNNDLFFGIWSLLAVYTEMFQRNIDKSHIKDDLKRLPDNLKNIIFGRLNGIRVEEEIKVLKTSKLKSKQKTLIENWIQNKLDFIK